MLPTVYVETTIFGYLTARPTSAVVAAARQQGTQAWWASRRAAFALYVSELVLEEAAAGDSEAAERRLTVARTLPLVNVTDSALRLAQNCARWRAFPPGLAPMPCISRWPRCTELTIS